MDHHSESGKSQPDRRKLKFENGKIYFSKDAERKFFFILTLIGLAVGACFKLGILQ